MSPRFSFFTCYYSPSWVSPAAAFSFASILSSLAASLSTAWRTKSVTLKYPNLRKTLARRNEMYNAQMELVERLEHEGKILVIRPERPLEVGRLCKDTDKMRRLYDEGYEVAKRTFEKFLR